MELQDQSGHAIEIPPADEEALKQGMLFLRRARAALRAATVAVAPAEIPAAPLPSGHPAPASVVGCAPDKEHVAPSVAVPRAPTGSAASPEMLGRREQLLLALALCQEGSASFDRVDPRYVECMVDNAAMCWMQVKWAGLLCFRMIGGECACVLTDGVALLSAQLFIGA